MYLKSLRTKKDKGVTRMVKKKKEQTNAIN